MAKNPVDMREYLYMYAQKSYIGTWEGISLGPDVSGMFWCLIAERHDLESERRSLRGTSYIYR